MLILWSDTNPLLMVDYQNTYWLLHFGKKIYRIRYNIYVQQYRWIIKKIKLLQNSQIVIKNNLFIIYFSF